MVADKEALYPLDKAWLDKHGTREEQYRHERHHLISTRKSKQKLYQLDCKWYQQTGRNDEWYNLKKSSLLLMGSLREIRTFENTHEVKRRSYLSIGKWLYLRRRRQWNTRQVVLRIGSREWILFKMHKRTTK